MRRPITLLLAMGLVAGLELAIFAASDQADPATARTVVVGSCVGIMLLWLLARTTPAAATPTWPANRDPVRTPYVDSRTRYLETLLSPERPAGTGSELADILAEQLSPQTRISADLAGYLTAARAGRNPRPPAPDQLARWLAEIEDDQ